MPNPPVKSDVESTLLSLLPGEWDIHRNVPAADGTVDIILQSPSREVLVEVKRATAPRVEDVQGRLALGTLHLNAHQPLFQQTLQSRVVVVTMPRLGPRIVAEADRFMAKYAPGVGWVLMDDTGALRAVVPEMGVDINRRGKPIKTGASGDSPLRFSDLDRWMLKVLLLRNAPVREWGGPRAPAIWNPTELARVAGCSVERAHRFALAMTERGFLMKSDRGLELSNTRECLDLLLQADRLAGRRPTPMQFVRGRPRSLAEVSPRERSALVFTGFEACRRMDLLHAAVAGLPEAVVQAGRISDEALDLVPCALAQAHVVVTTIAGRSAFDGAVVGEEGVRTADVLQAALDVQWSPARGREQAEFLVDRIVGAAATDG